MSNLDLSSILNGENSEIFDEVLETFLAWKRTKIKFYKPTQQDLRQVNNLRKTIITFCAPPHLFTKAQFYMYKDGMGFEINPVKFDSKYLNTRLSYDKYVNYRNIEVKPKIKDHYAEVLYNQNNELSVLLADNEALDREQVLLDILLDENSDLFSWYRVLQSVYLNDTQRQQVLDKYGSSAALLITEPLLSELEDKTDLAILKEIIKK